MEVICIQEDAYFDLLKKSYEYIKTLHNIKEEKWILPDKAMEMLGVKTTKLQELRDNGEIEISQPTKKVILYNIDSIREYLNKHARKS
ncbi:hypothetical protein ACVW0P_000686 [Mucilaginibacter sp. UYNi724]